MNRIFSIVLLLIVFVVAGLAQTPCERFAAADFSICQPASWTAAQNKDDQFKTISGIASGGLKANMVFNEEPHPLKLSEYVDATNKYTLEHGKDSGFSSVTLLSRTAIVTDTNETGFKTTLLEEFDGNKLCGFQYIFDTGKNKLLITFTTFDSERVASEKLFDATIKTLKIDHSTP